MKIVFIGSVKFSAQMLKTIINHKGDVVGVCTLKNSSFNSDHLDLSAIAKKIDIPFKYTSDINSEESINWIKSLNPEIIFCFGWSKLIGNRLLKLSPKGVLGYHPSELPRNRGRHPLIWSLVLGLKNSASTFFFMDKGVDSGEILSQKKFEISLKDDASSLYKKIEKIASNQVKEFLPLLINNNYQTFPQNHKLSNTWRKREIIDGQIDWRMSSEGIYNLVRGLTRPYAGAHFKSKEKTIKVWKCRVIKIKVENYEPGKVINFGKKGPIVKSGNSAIELIDFEPKIKPSIGDYL
tara:strand:+ start:7313 stop:8194 length:882 start_codon:yes stop_codon:yes gene_type:complete